MADDRGRGLPPPRDLRDDSSYLAPINVDDDDRSRGYQPRMIPVSLPPIQDHAGGPPPHARYPPLVAMDPRDPGASTNYGPSPATANGYQPPPPQPGGQYLPPVDPRVNQYAPPPPDPYGRPPAPHPGAYAGPAAYDYRHHQGPAPGYPPDPRTRYAPDYSRAPMPGQPQLPAGAPRQRTSIACKYCRRRKIRCSGYQNGGKCSNCVKMNQDCIFQPVSSSTSTAFVPITAVQGALAPGTQLYGAYGQPLTSLAPGQAPPQGHYVSNSSEYPHSIQSPTAPYHPAPHETDRRRPREEEPMPPRLPPPNPYQEQDARRRSPATSSTNSPGTATYSSYPPPGGNYDAGSSTPTQQASPGGGTPNQVSSSGVMSLGNIMDGPSRSESTIDQNMLNRLNRPPPR